MSTYTAHSLLEGSSRIYSTTDHRSLYRTHSFQRMFLGAHEILTRRGAGCYSSICFRAEENKAEEASSLLFLRLVCLLMHALKPQVISTCTCESCTPWCSPPGLTVCQKRLTGREEVLLTPDGWTLTPPGVSVEFPFPGTCMPETTGTPLERAHSFHTFDSLSMGRPPNTHGPPAGGTSDPPGWCLHTDA